MKSHTSCIALGALLTGAALLLNSASSDTASAEDSQSHCDPSGVWVGTSPDGSIFTETLIADASGKRFRYTIEGLGINNADVTLGGLFPGVGASGLAARGEGVRIAPNTFRYKSIIHGIVDNPPGEPNDYSYIRIDEGVSEFVDCNTQHVTNNLSIYLAEQDADQDGLPDPGESPIIFVPDLPVQLKRLSVE